MRALFALGVAATALAVPPALAGVYKCLGEDGRPFYQEEACPAGRELRDFEKDPANVSIVPFAVPRSASGGTGRSAAERHQGGNATEPHRAGNATGKHVQPQRASTAKGDATQRRFIRVGMSEAEVVALVGTPDMTAGRGRKGLRWTYMPVPDDRDTITNLVFENGHVADVERKVVRK
jgi:hypothetical protein